MYLIKLAKRAQKDAAKIERAGLKSKAYEILNTVRRNPFEPTQQFEKLEGSRKKPKYSRHINQNHRFVYTVLPNTEGLKDATGALYKGIVRVFGI
jgi:Txe/YoeB family toxin of toxin-antitoxin system